MTHREFNGMFVVSKMYEKPPRALIFFKHFPGLYPGPLVTGKGRGNDGERRDKKEGTEHGKGGKGREGARVGKKSALLRGKSWRRHWVRVEDRR